MPIEIVTEIPLLPTLSASDGVTIATAVIALWALAFVWKLLQRAA